MADTDYNIILNLTNNDRQTSETTNSQSDNNSQNTNTSSLTAASLQSTNVSSQLNELLNQDEPHCKKQKLSSFNIDDIALNDKPNKKLEDRLGDILACTVCLDDSKSSIYQCVNGHLMCSACFTHLLTDARLKDEQATCPNCRCEISRQLCSRSLVAEKVLSQLPTTCAYCSHTYLRCDIESHERNECIERPTRCTYSKIGCNWEGPYHELDNHIEQCYKITHPNKQTNDIIQLLKDKEVQDDTEKQSLLSVINLFSLEKVCFNDLQFRSYKTDDITPKLYFETARFSAFFQQWVLKARINDNQKNPNLTVNRYISYQLVLKSKLTQPALEVKFLILKGPFSDVNVNAKVQTFEFTSTKCETDYIKLALDSSMDCNKLLSSKVINVRLFMFQV